MAVSGDHMYFGVHRYDDSPEVLVGWRSDFAPDIDPGIDGGDIPGVAGGDVPVLAATGRGTVGVLAASERPGPSDLELTFIEDRAVTSTTLIEAQAQSYTYAMAGSEEALGIIWATPSGVAFTSRRP
jgi:hypothetical protein